MYRSVSRPGRMVIGRILRKVLVALVVLALTLLFLTHLVQWLTPPATSVIVVDRLRAVRELIGLVVEVAEVRQTSKSGYTGGIEVVLLVRGQAHLGVDLSALVIESVDGAGHSITISLPPLTVRVAAVDTQRTVFLRHQRFGLWSLTQVERVDRQVVATALSDAETAIRLAGQAHRTDAQQSIERTLTELTRQAGWQLTIHWREP